METVWATGRLHARRHLHGALTIAARKHFGRKAARNRAEIALFELIEFRTGFVVVPTLPVRIVLAALAIGSLVLALTYPPTGPVPNGPFFPYNLGL